MRLTARLLILASVGSLLVAVLVPGSSSSVRAQSSQVVGDGVASLRDCIVQQRRVSTVILVDESQSLRGSEARPGTDPEATRVEALQSVIGSLALLPGEDGAGVDVDVRIAGFGESYTPASGWTRLTPSTAVELNRAAEAFRDRDDAVDTDYVLAMEGALAELDTHAAETSQDGPTCRAVIILSDGEYSLGSSAGQKSYAPDVKLRSLDGRRTAVLRGLDQLCSPGGLVDRSRASGTVVVGLGLKLASQPSGRAELQGVSPLDFFTGLATGSSGGFTCGEPSSSRYGAIATSDDFGRLAVEVFCMLVRCVQVGDPTSVEVDRSVSKLVIVAASSQPGLALSLRSPDGSESIVPVNAVGETVVGSGTVAVSRQSDRLGTFAIAFDQRQTEQVGTWTVTGAGPGETSLAATPRSNLHLDIEGEPTWTIGEPGELSAQLMVADGIPVSPSDLSGTLDASLAVQQSSGEQVAVSSTGTDEAGRVQLAVDEVPDSRDGSLVAVATVGGTIGSTARPEQVQRRSIPLRRSGLPTVVVPPEGIRLSGVHGGGDGTSVATGSVQVLGDDDVSGTVCVTDVRLVDVPEDASGFSLAGDNAQCVEVGAGAATTLDVEVQVEQIRSGEYNGDLALDLRSPTTDESATVEAPVSFAGSAPVCTTVLAGVLALVVVGILLAALVLLFVVSRVTGRFPKGLSSQVQYARVENLTLTLDPSGATAIPDLQLGQFERFISDDGPGERGPYSVRDGGELRARPRLLALPDSRIKWKDGPVVGSRDGFLARRRVGRSGTLPLALAGGWAFGVRNAVGSGTEDDPYVVNGELWAFLDTGAGREFRLRRLNADLRQRLLGPSLAAVAARTVVKDDDRTEPAPPPTDPNGPLPL